MHPHPSFTTPPLLLPFIAPIVGLKYFHDPFQADPARQYTASFILTYGGGQVRYTAPHHTA